MSWIFLILAGRAPPPLLLLLLSKLHRCPGPLLTCEGDGPFSFAGTETSPCLLCCCRCVETKPPPRLSPALLLSPSCSYPNIVLHPVSMTTHLKFTVVSEHTVSGPSQTVPHSLPGALVVAPSARHHPRPLLPPNPCHHYLAQPSIRPCYSLLTQLAHLSAAPAHMHTPHHPPSPLLSLIGRVH